MGSGRAAQQALPRINSETNLAVQLLLAVRDGRIDKPHVSHLSHPRTPPSVASSDPRAETSDDSDATDVAVPAVATPPLKQKGITSTSPSPRALGPPAKNDSTFFKYTPEERQEALERFREKKRRRQFHKRVRYMVRKRLAETRPRYKGRFSKPPPGENYDDGTPGPPAENPQPAKPVEQQSQQVDPTKGQTEQKVIEAKVSTSATA